MIETTTKKLLAGLPQWMKMRNDDSSVGAQFLNVFGLEFKDIEEYLDESLNNGFISTTDISQIDWIYKVANLPINNSTTIKIYGDGVELDDAHNLEDFYGEEKNLYMTDPLAGTIYFRNKYNSCNIVINQVNFEVTQIEHHVWNAFDEFALLLGLSRNFLEDNKHLRDRIIDVFKRPANSSTKGLKNGIGRDLNIAPAHVQLDNMYEKSTLMNSLYNENGSATDKLLNIINRLNTKATAVWGNAVWDTTYWQTIEEDYIGLSYLPRLWAITFDSIDPSKYQSGIGYGDDLKVKLLETQEDQQEFNYTITVQGTETTEETVYAPHKFNYRISAKGYIPAESAPPQDYYYTIEAAEIIPLTVNVNAHDESDKVLDDNFSQITADYTLNNTEVVPSNKIQNTIERFVQIIVTMESEDGVQTPILDNISFDYVDSTGTPKTVSVASQAEFNEGLLDKTEATSDNTLQLAMGTFDYKIGEGEANDFIESVDSSNFLDITANSIKMKGIS
jgi:hypothetical protein